MRCRSDNIISKSKTGEDMVENTNEKKGRNIFWTILFGVIVPLIVVIAIVLVIMQMSGVDTVGWAKEKLGNASENSALTEEKERLKEKVAEQKTEIEDLTKEVESLESIKDDLELDIKKLENRTNEDAKDSKNSNDYNSSSTNSTGEEEISEEEAEIKNVASSFRKMEPEKAAKIVEELDKEISEIGRAHV